MHKSHLVDLLKAMYSDATLAPLLGFKGGTAAYLFYDLPRFSVDLDFNLLSLEMEDLVFEKVGAIAERSFEVKEKYKKRYTLFFVLSYDRDAQNIKIEISRRARSDRYELKQYLGIPMLVMVKEDMVAHKLIALLDRRKPANRDLFDVWFFLSKKSPINKTIIEDAAGLPFSEYLKKCIVFVEGLDGAHILGGLGELLDAQQKVWVKQHLRDELLFALRLRLEVGE